MKLRTPKPSPAMVVACIALLVALSGASYAAIKLPRNSVGTPQLKKNAVTSVKVRNRSLKALDFAAGQLPAGPQGTQGIAGPQGPPGPTAVASSGTGTPPAVSGDSSLVDTTTITTAVPGKLFVGGQITPTESEALSISCDPAVNCGATVGIYVDNAPVPGSARTYTVVVPGGTMSIPVVIVYGILPNVSAGAHTVRLRVDPTATMSSMFIAGGDVQAIAMG